MFGKMKEMLAGAGSKLSGKTDLLEAIAAGGILVAAADGDMSSDEVSVLLETLKAHETLSTAFSEAVIDAPVQKMINRASPNAAGKIGMVGKMNLEKEVREAKAKSSSDEMMLMMAILCDVAGASGEIEPAEKTVINKISNSLGLGAFI